MSAASRPRRRAAARRTAEDDVTAGEGAPAPKRRTRAECKQTQSPAGTVAEQAAGDGGPWPSLPHAVLCQVLLRLDHEDVVSVGQVCSSWRQVARHRDVWRRRVVEYQVTDYSSRHFSNHWHANAQRFARIVRFAPCAARISCNRGMQPAARKALFTQSQCEPQAVELNGATVAAVKYLNKWSMSIRDVTLLNPSLQCLQAATSLPELTALAIQFKFDVYKSDYKVPSFEGLSSATLIKLTFYSEVHDAAIDSLILAHAATLEDVSTYSFPSAALSACPRLRGLALDVEPEAQGQALLALLGGREPLQRLAFSSFGSHNPEACAALRNRIKSEGLVDEQVPCDSCERGGPVYIDLHRMRGRPRSSKKTD